MSFASFAIISLRKRELVAFVIFSCCRVAVSFLCRVAVSVLCLFSCCACSALGWSVVCDCDIYWSYPLAFGLKRGVNNICIQFKYI